MPNIEDREVSIPLGVVVEKRKSNHPWADWQWIPVAVFVGADERARWVKMLGDETFTRYHCKTVDLVLHRKETEAYKGNLSCDAPHIYVVLQTVEYAADEFPYDVQSITASPYEAQDYLDSGEDIVEKVAMPEAVAAFIKAFVEQHHQEEVFIKRKRDKLKIEDQKFGKEPIFASSVRMPKPGDTRH